MQPVTCVQIRSTSSSSGFLSCRQICWYVFKFNISTVCIVNVKYSRQLLFQAEMCLNHPDWAPESHPSRIKLLLPIQPPDPLQEFFFLRLNVRRLFPVELFGSVHCDTKFCDTKFVSSFFISCQEEFKPDDGTVCENQTAGSDLNTPHSLWAKKC